MKSISNLTEAPERETTLCGRRFSLLWDLSRVDALRGAKHKLKEKEKADKRDASGHFGDSEGHDLTTGAATPRAKGEKEKKKKKKNKEDKDKSGGEALKRPLSAYMLYNNHRRPILKKEHASNVLMLNSVDLSLPEVSKMIGEEWSKLTQDQKKVSNISLI